MIKRSSSLRNRVALSLALFAVSIAIIILTLGDLVNEKLEENIWRSTLEAELTYFLQARQTSPESKPPATADLTTYVWRHGTAIPKNMPPIIAKLEPGIHDEISLDDHEYCVLVRDINDDRIFMRYDITRLEEKESQFVLIVSIIAVAALIGIIVISFLLAQHLVKSVHQLANRVATLDPTTRGAQIGMSFSEREVAVIAEAIDRYLQRMDGFMENEKEFVDSASHELRTPIAIISGAAEVISARSDFPAAAKPAMQRLCRAAHEMNETVTALFYLAKDSAYLASLAEPIQLDKIINQFVAENKDLAVQKQIEIKLSLDQTTLNAPIGIVTTIINNLLRNALVHTEQGSVSIELHTGVLIVANTSNTIAPEELATIFMKRVRGSGTTHREGTGLGLYIIKRICERMQWHVEMSSDGDKGTVVRVDLHMNII